MQPAEALIASAPTAVCCMHAAKSMGVCMCAPYTASVCLLPTQCLLPTIVMCKPCHAEEAPCHLCPRTYTSRVMHDSPRSGPAERKSRAPVHHALAAYAWQTHGTTQQPGMA